MGINYNFLKLGELWEENKKIKFMPGNNLGFPVGDALSFDENTSEVKLGFMGLMGVDSPLPHYFIKKPELLNMDLLKIINHKIYVLYYLSIKKSRGWAMPNPDEAWPHPYAAISRENLYKNLKLYLGNVSVTVHEFNPKWIELENGNACLGERVLGEKILDTSSGIIIEIGPVNLEQAQHYRKDNKLDKIISNTIESHIKFKFKFLIHSTHANHVVIGQWIMH
jgi:predicted component of type VI protein secretion system